MIYGIFVLFFLVILVRLYNVQVVKHEYYSKKAESQVKKYIKIRAPRGKIYDRNFNVVAENVGESYYFGINTKKVTNKKDLAKRLAKITGEKYKKYEKALKSKKGFVWVCKGLDGQQKKEILSVLNSDESYAASFNVVPNRIYPYGYVGGQVLGYTGVDGEGLDGVELYFNEKLEGEEGWEYVWKDAMQRKTYSTGYNRKEPKEGNSLVLTIDKDFQAIVEDELENAVTKWKAKKASCVVVDPHSGEVLALASYPNFDPNRPGDFDPASIKNKAITDIYEPGSTLKTIAAAALLEEGLTKESEVFFCDNDGLKIGSRTIKDSHKHENENLTFHDVLVQSSNVGIAKAIARMSDEDFYTHLRSFGFGERTDLPIKGEVSGTLWKIKHWNKLTKANMSFGQGISATPLQVAMAYCAIANGGRFVRPLLVKGILDDKNEVIEEFETIEIRRVISESTSKRIRNILKDVVTEEGTAPEACVTGISVAGKTGTSQKAIKGGYSRTDYDASFAGFFPHDNPQVVCVVVVDTPKPYHWGGMVAGPVFKNISERIIAQRRAKLVKSDIKRNITARVVPDLIGFDMDRAEEILEKENICFMATGQEDIIKYQSIEPYTIISEADTLVISSLNISDVKKEKVIPAVVGLSLRDAIDKLSGVGVEIIISGNGNVYRQFPKHGKLTEETKVCSLYLSPLKKEKLYTEAMK